MMMHREKQQRGWLFFQEKQPAKCSQCFTIQLRYSTFKYVSSFVSRHLAWRNMQSARTHAHQNERENETPLIKWTWNYFLGTLFHFVYSYLKCLCFSMEWQNSSLLAKYPLFCTNDTTTIKWNSKCVCKRERERENGPTPISIVPLNECVLLLKLENRSFHSKDSFNKMLKVILR